MNTMEKENLDVNTPERPMAQNLNDNEYMSNDYPCGERKSHHRKWHS